MQQHSVRLDGHGRRSRPHDQLLPAPRARVQVGVNRTPLHRIPDAAFRVKAGWLPVWSSAAARPHAGLRLPDARAITGPPDGWVQLPDRDWWSLN